MDNRIKELMLSENERKAAQNAFIDQQSMAHLNRERYIQGMEGKV